MKVALLTGGRDKPYALGLGPALADQGITVDFVGSDAVDGPEVRNHPNIHFRNLRNQAERASLWEKSTRVLVYYSRLCWFALRSEAPIFHVLWTNKFEYFDRTVLMGLYRLLGKKLVFTVHNVNIGERDGTDSWLNRLTLRLQYRLCHHLFVHTRRMRDELMRDFAVRPDRISVIPFGINNTLPNTGLTAAAARVELSLAPSDQVLLFFGNIAPYKGVDVLVAALERVVARFPNLRLIVAGRPKGSEEYWAGVQTQIRTLGLAATVRERIEYIPDEKVEVFFKAADVLVIPYRHVFQSGVLFVGYSFGLPAIVTDVGALREEIREDETGWVCRPEDADDLAKAIATCLDSDLFRRRHAARSEIQAFANRQYSWTTVGGITRGVYESLLKVDMQAG